MGVPYTFRPTKRLFLAVAPLLENDEYLDLDETQFVGRIMKATGGALDPSGVAELFRQLRKEAGC